MRPPWVAPIAGALRVAPIACLSGRRSRKRGVNTRVAPIACLSGRRRRKRILDATKTSCAYGTPIGKLSGPPTRSPAVELKEDDLGPAPLPPWASPRIEKGRNR